MTPEELQEIRCLRAVLERILRVMDEGLFVDYQMEKFGKIGYKKKFKKIVKEDKMKLKFKRKEEIAYYEDEEGNTYRYINGTWEELMGES